MLFRTLAVLAIAPALVLARPTSSRRHSLNKRCNARNATSVAVAPATNAVQGVNISATPSPTDVVDTTPTPVDTTSTDKASPSVSTDDATKSPVATKTSAPSETPTASSTKDTDASTSTTSSKPTATSKPSNNIPVGSGLLSALFPNGQGNDLWSTATGLVGSAVKLTMDAFKASSVSSHAPAIFTDDALKVNFLQGSWTFKGPGPSGLSFYAQPLDLSNAKEATLSYQVMFDDDFDFNQGGKLPGLYGGESDEVAKSCSGGRRSTDCHSLRYMWRSDGRGELYTYLPDPSLGSAFAGNKNLCTAVEGSECNDVYGASVGRGSFTFPRGEYITIAQRAKLNDVGKSNGELELIVNGESMFTVTGLAYRDKDSHIFRGAIMQSFFGGSTSDWASPKDQSLQMKDFSVAVTEQF